MTEPNPWRRVRLALVAVAFVLVAGTVGFTLILHLSVLDAFYDTTTVVTTIGFREPKTLTSGAKIFTVVLILAGVSTVLYAFGVVLEAILEGHLRDLFGRRRMERTIASMSDHVIVCGWGRVGRAFAANVGDGQEVVVVDTIVTVTNGSATADAHVSVGSVTVNGQPVSITDQGITVQQKSASCPSSPGGGVLPSLPGGPVPSPPSAGILPSPSPPTLPGAHTGCATTADLTYVKIFAVAPVKTVNGTHATVSASGMHVLVTHPTPGPGVPQQSTEYVLGEGYAEASTGSGGGGFSGGGFGFTGGDFGFNGPNGGDNGLGSPNSAASVAHAIFSNLFLTLEALILGSAAAWVWSRNAPSEDAVDEVLAP